jgi:hypothetical protein
VQAQTDLFVEQILPHLQVLISSTLELNDDSTGMLSA